jgi:CubicO group peptidase (beta-lactamase class C family)
MRHWGMVGGFALAAAAAAASAVAAVASAGVADGVPDKVATVREVYDGTMTSDVQVNTFRHIERLFPTRVVRHGAQVASLPKRARQLGNFTFKSAGKPYDLIDFMALDRVTGLLVLKDGQIAYEDYEMGNDANARWISMSLVKTMTSSMIGAAIQDGFIKSIDDPVTKYLPQFKGSAYDGVSIRNLVQMASGVKWDETYTDPKSDRRAMLDAQIAQKPGAILALMAKLPRGGAPGSVWNYSTGETYVAGAVLRAAVGKPIAQYLSERIWIPAGMESDAVWWLDSPDGQEIGGGGLAATLRDYGRFGLLLMNDGVVGGKRILPEGWVREASSSKMVGGKKVDYGYFIWPIDAAAGSTNFGAYEAIGIFGQYIYVNPREHVVAVMWGAQPKPVDKETIANEDFFAGVAEAVR